MYTDEEEAEMDAVEAHYATLPFTPGPWLSVVTKKDHYRVISMAYNDETPGVCGDHSKSWRLSEADARCIALIPDLYEFLVSIDDGCDSAGAKVKARELLARFKGED